MQSKHLMYIAIIVPVLALALAGAGIASAHGWFGAATPEEVASRYQTMFQRKADLLGMSVDEFKNAWAAGKTFSEIAQEHGISEEDLRNRMTDARKQQLKKQLQTLVEKGIITQQQADQRFEFMEEKISSGTFAHGRMGMGSGGHFHHGWR